MNVQLIGFDPSPCSISVGLAKNYCSLVNIMPIFISPHPIYPPVYKSMMFSLKSARNLVLLREIRVFPRFPHDFLMIFPLTPPFIVDSPCLSHKNLEFPSYLLNGAPCHPQRRSPQRWVLELLRYTAGSSFTNKWLFIYTYIYIW